MIELQQIHQLAAYFGDLVVASIATCKGSPVVSLPGSPFIKLACKAVKTDSVVDRFKLFTGLIDWNCPTVFQTRVQQ
eukprot:snap_masked-scaffold_54-processed-gene-1.38-mRNA-1 protein AED:1.00 eAED:1.00 QI:0/0/0/0/1/1/3/0/76